jgi:hypothetical protein
VIVRLPDLRLPKAAAPTINVAFDPPHIQPAPLSGVPSERSATKLDGPHWGRFPIAPESVAADRPVLFTKHPLISQAIGLAQRRAELLLVLAGVTLLQIAMQYAWRTPLHTAPGAHPAVAAPAVAAPAVAAPVAATGPSVPVQSPVMAPEVPTLPRAAETVGSPAPKEAAMEPGQPVVPSAPPASPETGNTTEPRDVPPWESWPNQPKAAEPASNQAASNTPARVSEPVGGPTFAAPRSDMSDARPKSLARLKGTISKPQVEPTHEHARRSLY